MKKADVLSAFFIYDLSLSTQYLSKKSSEAFAVFIDKSCGCLKSFKLGSGEVDFKNLLNAVFSKFDRNTAIDIVDTILSLNKGCARDDTLFVFNDSFNHFYG